MTCWCVCEEVGGGGVHPCAIQPDFDIKGMEAGYDMWCGVGASTHMPPQPDFVICNPVQ